jgi:hypothetical protein
MAKKEIAARMRTATGIVTPMAIFAAEESPPDCALPLVSAGAADPDADNPDADLEDFLVWPVVVADDVGDMAVTRFTVAMLRPSIVGGPIEGSIGQPLAVEDGHTGVVIEGVYLDFWTLLGVRVAHCFDRFV